jgi:hypothetical protein
MAGRSAKMYLKLRVQGNHSSAGVFLPGQRPSRFWPFKHRCANAKPRAQKLAFASEKPLSGDRKVTSTKRQEGGKPTRPKFSRNGETAGNFFCSLSPASIWKAGIFHFLSAVSV